MTDPVIQVIDESDNESIYTPCIGDPDSNTFQTPKNLQAPPSCRKKPAIRF